MRSTRGRFRFAGDITQFAKSTDDVDALRKCRTPVFIPFGKILSDFRTDWKKIEPGRSFGLDSLSTGTLILFVLGERGRNFTIFRVIHPSSKLELVLDILDKLIGFVALRRQFRMFGRTSWS